MAVCSTCSWFREDQVDGDAGPCFEAPPVPFVLPMNGPNGVQPQVIAVRPMVRRDDGCSRHVVASLSIDGTRLPA